MGVKNSAGLMGSGCAAFLGGKTFMSGTMSEREVSRLFRVHLRGRLTLGEFARASRGVSDEVLRAMIEGEYRRVRRWWAVASVAMWLVQGISMELGVAWWAIHGSLCCYLGAVLCHLGALVRSDCDREEE
jgi:hypothetical protein